MESPRRSATIRIAIQFAVVCAAAALLVVTGGGRVAAQEEPGGGYTPNPDLPAADVRVESGPNGVTIYIAMSDLSPGSSTDPTGGDSAPDSGGPSCRVDVMNIGVGTLPWFEEEAPLHPGELPFLLYCDDEFLGVVWIPVGVEPSDVEIIIVPGDTVDPTSVAADLLDHIPVPNVTLGVNPDVGLVAVPSWFWVEGYDGSPILASDTLGGTTVEVEIAPTGYLWSFGDGAALTTTSLGQAYPAESDVRHAYEQSSLSAGGAFSLTLEITFSARYRVDGGPWQPLDSITRLFTAAYPVQQLQSILTGE
jgi:hypothetical protein